MRVEEVWIVESSVCFECFYLRAVDLEQVNDQGSAATRDVTVCDSGRPSSNVVQL